MPLLEKTVALKEDLGVPVQIHAANSPLEWQYIVERDGCTPIELRERVGLLGPEVIIGHGQLVAENPLTNWAGGRDLEILGSTTVPVSCTSSMRRRQFVLNSPAGTARSAEEMAEVVIQQVWSYFSDHQSANALPTKRNSRSRRLRDSERFDRLERLGHEC